MTIPGQALEPADLMKRHLAGTLPPIDLSKSYEYHYDEDGNKIADRLPNEVHALHELAVALRKKQFEVATEQRKQQLERERARVIEEYEKQKAESALAAKELESPPVQKPSPRKKAS